MFSGWDKQLADVRAKKAKAQALLQNLDAPRIAFEQLARQEAELEARRERVAVEADQLQVERAGIVQNIARLDAVLTHQAIVISSLDMMVAACEGGLVGSSLPVAHTRRLFVKAGEDAKQFRASVAAIDRRLKELDR